MVGMYILETVYKGTCARATGQGAGKMALVSSSPPFFGSLLFCFAIVYFYFCFVEFSIFVVAAEFGCTTFSLPTLSCLMLVA